MVHWLWIFVGLFVGSVLGFVAAALCHAARDEYPDMLEHDEPYRRQHGG